MKKITFLFTFLFVAHLAVGQDTCATATPLTGDGLYVVTSVNGTETPNPFCTTNSEVIPSHAEWFSYTPTQDYTVTISTSIVENTPRVDTRFHVYTGVCGALICHGGDDDSGTNYSSVDTFNVLANTTYYIAFDSRWSSSGFTFSLIQADVVVPPPTPITFTKKTISTINSSYNICAVDMNNDFNDDIVGVSGSNIRIHYQNPDGTFTVTDIPTQTAEFLPTWSLAAGDYNKDGYNDLLYGSGSGLTFMKSSNNGTTYSKYSPGQYVFSQRTNFVDLDNDGNLDAFACHDVDPNVYYMNDGAGNLTYHQSGTPGAYMLGISPNGGNYGSMWVDYDNDGDLDLFIAKCGSVPPDELHRNNGDGTFSDISVEMNLYDNGQSWSAAWADYDNDGDMDVMVGASTGAHKLKLNNLDKSNNVEEPFTDITAGSGWDSNNANNIEHIAYDFDNDGFVDIMGGGNKIMFNLGNLTFGAVAYNNLSVGAVGDFNNDGFLDIQNGGTIHMSDGNANNWIKLNVRGVESNSNGIGARVEIYGAFGKQIRDIRSGEGFKYMSTMNVHFGIGLATEITKVVVKWPSGTVDIINNPAINQPLFVLEGSSPELGITDVNAVQFNLYPNPAKHILNVKNSENITLESATIFNLSGKQVFNSAISDGTISVENLATGTYLIVLKDINGKKYTQKFLKN